VLEYREAGYSVTHKKIKIFIILKVQFHVKFNNSTNICTIVRISKFPTPFMLLVSREN